ncbi:MAG: PKD domain-containing protein, partial [Vicingaceae bacterium]|nr:PKD domain-containing protein [Vicingaceae bacterium]
MNNLIKNLSFFLLALFSSITYAQVVYTEDFETLPISWTINSTDLGSIGVQTIPANQWIRNNVYAPGQVPLIYSVCSPFFSFPATTTPNQNALITGNANSNYLHIYYNDMTAPFNAVFVDNSVVATACGITGTNFAKMTNDVSTIGLTGVSFNYYYLGANGGNELYFSTNGGTTWTLAQNVPVASVWTSQSIVNAAFDNQATLRFGILFNPNVNPISDPPFSIDQIEISAPLTTGPIANFNASATTVCVGGSITFTNTSSTSGATTYAWTFPGGTPGNANTIGPHTVTFNTVGTQTISLTVTDANGTDNITIPIIVVPTSTGTDVITSCTPITWIDGNTYSASTTTPTFTIVGGSSQGCDSIVTLNLTINSTVTGTDVITSCTPITWIDGNAYSASTTTPTFILVGGSSQGCDSIVTLNLTINSAATGTDVITSCTPITWIDGNTYSASTTTPTFT